MDKIIFFTKAPRLGFGKSRLKNYLDENQRLQLTIDLINENYKKIKKTNKDYVIYYDGSKNDIDFLSGEKIHQQGDDLGTRMKNSIDKQLSFSNKVILIGSDLINLSEKEINRAFEQLDFYDIVISPSDDGGYGLVGMKESLDIFSNIVYSKSNVLVETIKKIKEMNKTYKLLDEIYDIDDFTDLLKAEFSSKDIELLGAGEYNINYKYKNKVIRINLQSQLGLGKEQIKYEYNALKELEKSTVTPKAYELYDKGKYLPFGFLTMEFIEGRALDYNKDLEIAAYMLSKIHSTKIEDSKLIFADKPFKNMYEEFEHMYSYYKDWENKNKDTEKYIDKFMLIAKRSGLNKKIEKPCIINTELNNRNFIIGENSKVIDWEKPIIGECEQDLAHFLVPTTTNWKTDVILDKKDMLDFLNIYKKYRKVDMYKFFKYLMFNSLRGVTWCSMAKVEYSKERKIKNEDTIEKINKFLSQEYLEMLSKLYEEFK